jgi:hypothetical protein
MIDRYTTGLRLSEYNLLPISLTDKPVYEGKLILHPVHLVIGENQVKGEVAYEIKILNNDQCISSNGTGYDQFRSVPDGRADER